MITSKRRFGAPHRMAAAMFFATAFGSVSPSAQASTFLTIHDFGSSTSPSDPVSSLIQASDGNLYTTTFSGGTNGAGTVIKLTTTGTVTVLHSFLSSATNGGSPMCALIQAADGNFYGTTTTGGAHNGGTVFSITPTGTFTIIHSFVNTATDGALPMAGVIQAVDGNLYGTTEEGGAHNGGIVYKIATSGSGFTILHSFLNTSTDGASPECRLCQGSDGAFYGTTNEGGAHNGGTVFKITSAGAVTLLHSFINTATDGASPVSGVIQATDGNLYGITPLGGSSNGGTLYRCTKTGTWTLLHSFIHDDGTGPQCDIVQAPDGNLYGTATNNGTGFNGTFYKATTAGALTVLHPFANGTDGALPVGGVIRASDGNFYGTTSTVVSGSGSVFKFTP